MRQTKNHSAACPWNVHTHLQEVTTAGSLSQYSSRQMEQQSSSASSGTSTFTARLATSMSSGGRLRPGKPCSAATGAARKASVAVAGDCWPADGSSMGKKYSSESPATLGAGLAPSALSIPLAADAGIAGAPVLVAEVLGFSAFACRVFRGLKGNLLSFIYEP